MIDIPIPLLAFCLTLAALWGISWWVHALQLYDLQMRVERLEMGATKERP